MPIDRPVELLLDWLNAPQRARLLKLSYPHENPSAARLLPNRFVGKEYISRDFEYTVELLSDQADISLEEMHGKMLCISLVQADGRLRHFTGYVSQFSLKATTGGVVFYEAVLVPWFAFTRLRQNNRVFTDQTLRQQTQSLLAEYAGWAQWEWQVTGEDPAFTMAVQFGESDHNYLSRRHEHAGLSRHYVHTEKGHTMRIGDDTCTAEPIDALQPAVRYHSKGGPDDEDAIAQWTPLRSSLSAQRAVSGYDFKNPQPVHIDVPSVNAQGSIPQLEVHSYEGHYGFKNASGADALARRRMEEIEARGKQYRAAGNCSRIQAGHWFRLTDHFGYAGDDAEFLVVEVEHEATCNYLQASGVRAEYKNRFVCQPRAVPWRPGPGFDSTDTRILAPQTATVVGPKETGSLHVDAYGRVRVQFHWDRAENRSCWIRVASNWAGGENGFVSHPRVGSEAVIQFLDGQPDHPIVTHCVFNQRHMPPWQLPQQAALTGLRGRELTADGGNSAGGRSNHLVMDDTAGQLQAQLKSDHLTSQLSLGHITRIEDNAGRKDARGQGFEVATEGHGAARAAAGLLITTERRPNARAHITDMGETLERLALSHELHDHLAQAATQASAQDAGDQDEVVRTLASQNEEIRGSGGNPQQGKFPEFQAPHLALASPAGIETSTQGSTHVSSIGHNAFTSGGHASLSAGKSLLVSVKDAVRMFAYRAGMRLVAAAGDIDITALKNSIHLLAQLDITHTAHKITINAKTQVEIVGGTSFTRWNASGIEHGSNGAWRQQAATHSVTGPANAPGPTLPQPMAFTELAQKQSLAFSLLSHPENGRALAFEPYELYREGALVEKGVTDANGQLIIKEHQENISQYAVKLSNGNEMQLPVRKALAGADEQQAAQGHRAA